MSGFLSRFEVWSAPHIGRGAFLAICFWSLGAWLFSLHWAMTFCLIAVLIFSVLWEFSDQMRYLWGKFLWWKTPSDAFDPWDIVADMTGAGVFALAIWAYQVLEKKLYNWPGLFR